MNNGECLSDEQLKVFFTKKNFPSEERYYEEKKQLEELFYEGKRAYSEQQINQLILKKSSKNAVLAVITEHEQLIAIGLTPAHIFEMAATDGGSKNLGAYQALITWAIAIAPLELEFAKKPKEALVYALDVLGLGHEQAVKMLANIGGSKNLSAYQALIPWAIAIAPPELEFAKKPKEALVYALDVLGIDREQAVKMLATHGGSKKITAIMALVQKITMTCYRLVDIFPIPNQIVNTILQKGGVELLKNAISQFFKWRNDNDLSQELLTLLQEADLDEIDCSSLQSDFQSDVAMTLDDIFDDSKTINHNINAPNIAHNNKRKAPNSFSLAQNKRKLPVRKPEENHLYGDIHRNASSSYSPLHFFSPNISASSIGDDCNMGKISDEISMELDLLLPF